MTVFVDASVLVAIVTQETGWLPFSDRLLRSRSSVTSALSVYEATLAIARKGDGDFAEAEEDLRRLLSAGRVAVVEIVPVDGDAAIAAHRRYGKGRHPAALNMGDCFAYACAKRLGASLLYKGDDFAKTDIRSAMDSR